jgi:glycosyltransferase involved in cell wall biosynthesis
MNQCAGMSPTTLGASIVIPVFNEREAIAATIGELLRRGFAERYEIIVVDDGSTDGSSEAVKSFSAVRLVRHATNRGYGAALKTGIRHARTDKVVFMDGDGQHSPDGIDDVVQLLDRHPLVIGERGADSRQDRSRLLGKRLVRILGEYLLGQKLPDFNSGFRGFRRSDIVSIIGILPNGFSFSTTSTLAFIKQGEEYATIPIRVAPRAGRPSSVRFFRDGLKTALLMIRIVMLFNPLKIFVPASILFGAGGIAWGIIGVLAAGRVPNSAVLTVVLGMFLFFIGIIADQISLLHFRFHEANHVPR